jgi:ABC-type phosphate/phosphonate transport system permease subunit
MDQIHVHCSIPWPWKGLIELGLDIYHHLRNTHKLQLSLQIETEQYDTTIAVIIIIIIIIITIELLYQKQ